MYFRLAFTCRFEYHGGKDAVGRSPAQILRRITRNPASIRQATRVCQAKVCAARKRNWQPSKRKWTTAWRCSATRAARFASATAAAVGAACTASGGATVVRSGGLGSTSIWPSSDPLRPMPTRMATYILQDQKVATRATWPRRTRQQLPLRLYHHALMRVVHTFPARRWTRMRRWTLANPRTSLFLLTRCPATRLWSCMAGHPLIYQQGTTSCKCFNPRYLS